jgi:hypothetical protein
MNSVKNISKKSIFLKKFILNFLVLGAVGAATAFAGDSNTGAFSATLVLTQSQISSVLDDLRGSDNLHSCLDMGKLNGYVDFLKAYAPDALSKQMQRLSADTLNITGFCASFASSPGLVQENDVKAATILGQSIWREIDALQGR